MGSQSLRKLELDARREIGVLIGNAKVVRGIVAVFETDWAATPAAEKEAKREKKEKKDNNKKKAKGDAKAGKAA